LNETILIGDNVRVTLLGIEGDKIKIGIDAPRDIKIFREELIEATRNTNQQALAAPIVSFDLAKIKKKSPPSVKENTKTLATPVKETAKKPKK
jgi:carbon storage regulator